MAITLNATISDEFANSYCTVSYADDYWDQHYSATKAALWTALSDEQKAQVLVQACRIIESAKFTEQWDANLYYASTLDWNRRTGTVVTYNNSQCPYKYDSTQYLQFPRNLDVDTAGDTFIPEEIKMAQCEQALYLLSVDETALNNQRQGIRRDTVSLKQGDVTLSQSYEPGGSLWSPVALEYVRPYLLKSGAKLRRS